MGEEPATTAAKIENKRKIIFFTLFRSMNYNNYTTTLCLRAANVTCLFIGCCWNCAIPFFSFLLLVISRKTLCADACVDK